jgi:hypothetical protein
MIPIGVVSSSMFSGAVPNAISIYGYEIYDGEGNPYDPPYHSVEWSPSPGLYYRIERSPDNINWSLYSNVSGVSNTLVTGPYYFRISAVNSFGIGEPSNSYFAY